MRTIKTLAPLMAAAAALLFVTPTSAEAQVSTQDVANCTDCYPCSILFPVEHDATGGGGRYAGLHFVCLDGTSCDGHPVCGLYGDASPAEREADDRLKHILNAMEGEERIAKVLDEFPDQATLVGNALRVEGMLCEEGEAIARLRLTDTQVAFLP